MIKKIHIVALFLLLSVPAHSQSEENEKQSEIEVATTTSGKMVLLMPDGTWQWAKSEERPGQMSDAGSQSVAIKAFPEISGPTLKGDLDKVSVFPDEFVNKRIRYKFVRLASIQSEYLESTTLHFVDVYSRSGKEFRGSLYGSMTFGVPSNMVNEMLEYYKKNRGIYGDSYPAHITTELRRVTVGGRASYFHAITCIQFVSIIGIKSKRLGKCE